MTSTPARIASKVASALARPLGVEPAVADPDDVETAIQETKGPLLEELALRQHEAEEVGRPPTRDPLGVSAPRRQRSPGAPRCIAARRCACSRVAG